jgi:phosphoribosylamine-glycine ligase
MESKGDGSNTTSYPDQSPFNYTTSQAATSYAGSMSATRRTRLDEDEQSKASFYTSYTTQTSGDREVKTEGGRVSFSNRSSESAKSALQGLQQVERHLLATNWFGFLSTICQGILTTQEDLNEWDRLFAMFPCGVD